MEISEADSRYIRELVYQETSIVLDGRESYLVESRLSPIVRRGGFASLAQLIAELRRRPTDQLRWNVIDAMTTNETYFFRDVHPFESLKTTVIPDLMKQRAAKRRLNIWSAAAASGQEAYSVMMSLREHFPVLDGWNVNVIASDISTAMLERCREGRYMQLEVNRGLQASLLVKYFRKVGLEWQIADELRQMLELRRINLARPWPSLPDMDLVFLRNVMIYFDMATKKKILEQLRTILRPDGYLFLGSAETTVNVDPSYHRVQQGNSVYYRIGAR